MGDGIRAEVQVAAARACPVARLSAERDAPSYSISRCVGPDGETMTEEFIVDSDTFDDGSIDDEFSPYAHGLEPVFSYGSKTAYRFERDRNVGCPCERVEAFGCPIVESHTRHGDLFLTFHAPDMETLRSTVGDLRDRFDAVTIRRLLRSSDDYTDHDLVFVDRGALTERQREVLRTAHEMGYFDHPKGANATEIAAALDISRATFSEHLAAAQRKLLGALVDSDSVPEA